MKQLKKFLLISFLFVIGNPSKAYASNLTREGALRELCNQLGDGNEAIVNCRLEEPLTLDELERYAVTKADVPDNLYDGNTIFHRGRVKMIQTAENCKVVIENADDIDQIDELANQMVQEIADTIGAGASDREKIAAICAYLTDTFSYDEEALYMIEKESDNSYRENVVTAYYGDRQIMCSEYSLIMYLMAQKMDVDCQMMHGSGHAYNAVRFKGTRNWIAYDLTSGTRYAQVPWCIYVMDRAYHPEREGCDSREASVARNLNGGIEPIAAGLIECLSVPFYLCKNGQKIVNVMKIYDIWALLSLLSYILIPAGAIYVIWRKITHIFYNNKKKSRKTRSVGRMISALG